MPANLKKMQLPLGKKRFCALLFFLSLLIFPAGCLQNHTVIIVKADGSGVIEETVLFSNKMFEMLDSFTAELKASDRQTKDGAVGETPESKENSEKKAGEPGEEMFLEMSKDAEKNAAQFGGQVKLVSVAPVKTAAVRGYRAVYAFSDIGQVRINQNPGNKLDEKNVGKKAPSKEEFITFTFTKGSPARLVVAFPDSQDEKGKETEIEKPDKSGEAKSDTAADKES